MKGSSFGSLGRTMIWEELRAEVETMIDGLGKEVDEGIVEAVTALRAFDFPTEASCEGHIECGCPYPWVDIEVPGSCERPNTIAEKEQVKSQRLLLENRLMELLDGFYAKRHPPYHAMLICGHFSLNCFRLRSAGGYVSEILGWGSCLEHFKLYQAEMAAFTNFLRELYLQSYTD